MTLRTKLILAQLPLALALALVGVMSRVVMGSLGQQSSRILSDNYRSVLAAQRMSQSLERIDRTLLFVLLGKGAGAAAPITAGEAGFEDELRVQEDHITEPGELEATRSLREAWRDYRERLHRTLAASETEQRQRLYFEELDPAFAPLQLGVSRILELNQDAMHRKGQRAERSAHEFEDLVVLAVVVAALGGLLASSLLTRRFLRPLGVVAATVRRFGQGDLEVRTKIAGRDEIAQLGEEFNTMAERLGRYRASSLGELIQAQQASQAAIDALPDPVIVLDNDGGLESVNAAASRILQIDPELNPKAPLEAAAPDVRAMIERLRTHVAQGRGSYVPRGLEEVARVTNAAGEYVLLPRAAPIYGETGNVTGAAIVLQDITRLFKFDELKSNLVATVAHEFRTPLTSLRMSIHLCTEGTLGDLSKAQADVLFSAREDCERLQGIVDDLLNLSRIESGHIELQRRRIEPQSLIDLALDVHRPAAEERQITLRGQVTTGCSEAFADPDRVQLVFTNLISNAIRHSPPGAEIRVSGRPEYASEPLANGGNGPGWVRFEVTDEGPGIPREHQAGLFEKFFRVPDSPEGGSGLGLFIARGIVQAHGGKVGVISEAGKGATFWFTIPVAPAIATKAEDRASA